MDDRFQDALPARQVFRTLLPYLKPYWRWLALAYGGLLGMVLTTVLQPWPLKLILDYVLLERPMPSWLSWVESTWLGDPRSLIVAFSVAIVVVVFLDGITSFVNRYFLAATGHCVNNDVRRAVFNHVQLLSQSFHTGSRSGDLVVRLTSDINETKKLLIGTFQDLSSNFLTLGGIVAMMLWMDWRLTLVALSVVPAIYFSSARFSGKVEELTRTKRVKESEVASIVQETVTSMAVVKAFGAESRESSRFARESRASLAADLRKTWLSGTFRRALQLLVAVGTALVVWYGANRVLSGAVSPGDLIVFTAYLKDLYKPIRGLSDLIVQFKTSLVSAQRITELLHTEIGVEDAPDAVPAPAFRGRVEFDNVTFGYKPDVPVLRRLSFRAEPGQLVALVGPSGAGKSTVVNLLLRFFDPWEGQVRIDDMDIRGLQLRTLREQMSVVLQDPIVFRRSIRENIAYGRPEATDEEIVEAAKQAQAHDFIAAMKKGYDTVLEERGVDLSGGQRQRIALARALLRNAPLLILDEPGTALDAVTEARLSEALLRLVEGRTAFVIAHRLSTIETADVILVFEEGRVVERGKHADLIAESKHYRRFYELQHRRITRPRADALGDA